MNPRLTSRSVPLLVVLLGVLAPLCAHAAGWRGVEPGVTPKAAVLKQFGEPMKVIHHKDESLVGYFAAHAIKGTRQVIFRVDKATDVVHRIDVFPATRITRPMVENSYGPACPQGTTEGPCFVQKIQDAQPYLFYESQGLAVFLKSDGKTVFSFVYLPITPKNEGTEESATAQSQPEDTSAHTEDAIDSIDESFPQATAGGSDAFASLDTSSLNEDPLKIGALVYMRGSVLLSKASSLKADSVQVPSLIDAYFDGRPTERLRAMVLARLTYDPALSGSPVVGPTGQTADAPNNPNVQLDQLWLNFDIHRIAFVTVGRQHVKWGTGRFWSPTDFLTPVRTDPLSTFDTRLGTDMLRINVPWEATSSNFTFAGLLDTHGPEASPLELGAAFRAETVLLGAEVGVDAVFRQNHLPEYGASLSSALGPLDLTAEVALRREMDYALYRPITGAGAVPYGQRYEGFRKDAYAPLVSAGLYYRWKLNDEKSLTFGGEGFYNSFGYENGDILPWLMANNAYLPFYAGKLYAAAYATYETTSLLNASSLTLTGLGNLSDHSYTVRVDFGTQVMTALNVELYAAAPLGHTGGEFRFGGTFDPFSLRDGTQVNLGQVALPQV